MDALKKIYLKENGNLEKALFELENSKRIYKYLNMLINSSDFENMYAFLDINDYQNVYRIIHGLKGVFSYLHLDASGNLCNEICDLCKSDRPDKTHITNALRVLNEHIFFIKEIILT